MSSIPSDEGAGIPPPAAAVSPAAEAATADTRDLQIAQLQAELAEAQGAAQLARDQALRAVAELENVRKRASREVEQAHRFGIEKLATELLAVQDSLELALANAGRGDAQNLLAGQEATVKLLTKAFERFAITPVDPVGEPFNPEQHEAMVMQPSTTAEPNSVLAVVQRGYLLHGRLLRPARVIVARQPD